MSTVDENDNFRSICLGTAESNDWNANIFASAIHQILGS